MKRIVLAKTISWYLFHFLMVATIGTIITGEKHLGVTIASAEMLFETALYYWHEHLWIWVKEKLQWH